MAAAALWVAIVALSAAACVIPDRDIRFEGGPGNPGAVRIVERTPLLPEMDEICNPDSLTTDADVAEQIFDRRFCPRTPASSQPSGLMRPQQGDFCICAEGDRRAIAPFSIYAEDPDIDANSPEDTLYGVLLLDPEPSSERPYEFVAYGNYFEACGRGQSIVPTDQEPGDRTFPSLEREEPALWRFQINDGTGDGVVDLCNNENGDSIPAGLHNLMFMVTDRPFYRPRAQDENGDPEVDENGDPVFRPLQCGVPDLAEGATYAVINFVFECKDEQQDADADCDCEEGP